MGTGSGGSAEERKILADGAGAANTVVAADVWGSAVGGFPDTEDPG